MMDLDNIPDTQTEAEELEEVVMGLIINSGEAGRFCRSKSHDGSVTDGIE